MTRLKVVLVLAVGAAFAATLLAELPFVNGPPYWQWRWRDLSLLRSAALLLAGAVPVGYVLSRLDEVRTSADGWRAAGTLAIANLLLQVGSVLQEPGGFGFVPAIVQSPHATNYFLEALKIDSLGAFLDGFSERDFGIHSGTHPPGPILFFYGWIRLLGTELSAIAGGWAIGAIAASGVLVVRCVAALWTEDLRVGVVACALYALLPALYQLLPQFDQAYPVLSMLMILLWHRSLEAKRGRAALLGVVLFISTMFAFNLLSMGAFLALAAGVFVWRSTDRGRAVRATLASSAVALSTFLLLHGLLALATGYDAIGNFANAHRHDQRIQETYICPYSLALVFCPYDFFLGAGMMTLPLLAMSVVRACRGEGSAPMERALTGIAVATIAIIDLTGLLYTETARLWLFLQPLVVVPAAFELTRFPRRDLLLFFAAQWAVGVVMKSKLSFMTP